ncbi:MAG: DUF2238 domain-containing protein [Neisseriaceae bacterium]|nr:DUF2238 domain-containing protein [Neisseriaceae bacterium]
MKKWLWVWLLIDVLVLIWSGIAPYDRLTWCLEVFPVLVVLPILSVTWHRFEFTHLVYFLIAVHAIVLMVGGTYSYARVPLGFWLQDLFGDTRNPYDKIGHFMQGLVPALVARELMCRLSWVASPKIASYLSVCVAMTVSAIYEILEWLVALLVGQGADEFLGTQGYAWDTQSDLLMALIGSMVAVLFFSRFHDAQIRRFERKSC